MTDKLSQIKQAAEAKNGLLPCPFCGGRAFTGVDGLSPDFLHHVSCSKCNACVQDCATEAEAIIAWNTRTPTVPALCKAVEEAKKILRFQGDHTSIIGCRRSAKLGLTRIDKLLERV
jgi:Lar family restriction alleviation protein